MRKYLLIFTVIIAAFIILNNLKNDVVKKEIQGNKCNFQSVIIVNGTSMTPMIQNGEKLKRLPFFYECNKVKAGDVVTYDYAGNKNLLLKKIMAIPGDKFEYNGKNIFINGVILKNSAGKKYNIKSKMLALYTKSYPIIPDEAYLILGDNIHGTKDSSKFGLGHIDQIKGKVIVD